MPSSLIHLVVLLPLRFILVTITLALVAVFDLVQLCIILPPLRRFVRRMCRAPCSRLCLVAAGVSCTYSPRTADFESQEEDMAEAYESNNKTFKLTTVPPVTMLPSDLVLSTLSAPLLEILYLDWLCSPDFAFPGLRKDTVVISRSMIAALDVACSKVPSMGGGVAFSLPVRDATISTGTYSLSPLVLFAEGACNDGLSILKFSPAAQTALKQNIVIHLVGCTSGSGGTGLQSTFFHNKSDTFISYTRRIISITQTHLSMKLLPHSERLKWLTAQLELPPQADDMVERNRILLAKLSGCGLSNQSAMDVL